MGRKESNQTKAWHNAFVCGVMKPTRHLVRTDVVVNLFSGILMECESSVLTPTVNGLNPEPQLVTGCFYSNNNIIIITQ